ncbi:MAG: extracellular solute-binding protein [Acetivibrio sp.]
MKKKSIITRSLALGLAFVMAGSMLTGCGGKDKKASQSVKMDKEHVYHAEYFKAPAGLSSINKVKVSNGRIYMDGYDETSSYGYKICSVNPDGGDEKIIYEIKQNATGENSNISNFAIDNEGNLCMFKSAYTEDKTDPENVQYINKNFIVKVDEKGKEIFSIELKGKEDFYPSNMLIDKENNIFLMAYESIEIYDKDGKHKDSIKTGNDANIDSAFMTEDGRMMVTAYGQDYSSREIKEYLMDQKKFSEPIKLEGNVYNYSFSEGAGYDLFLKDNTDLYGFNLDTKEKTKLINWIDSDINGSMIGSIAPLADGRIVCTTNNYFKNTTELAVLSKVEPKDVIEKSILTLAAVYVDMQVSAAVIEFNKKSDKYRITLKDYSTFNTEDDYMAGSKKLNTDIISGDVPDILCVSDTSSFDSCAAKGLFVDFNQVMEKDKDFDKSAYLENIMKCFEKNGKLYSMVPFFSPFSIVGKTTNVGSEMGWTMEDLEKLVASKPKGTKVFSGDMTKSSIMYYGNYLCMDEYIDRETGKCNFNTPDFIRLLEFANQFKEDAQPEGRMATEAVSMDDGMQNEELDYRTDKVLLNVNYLNSFQDMHQLQKVTFGEDITFIGFPTAKKNGSAISPGLQLAISAKSEFQDAAWEFVKTFFLDEFQDGMEWGWPVKISSLEKKKEKEQKPSTYKDENGKEVVYEDTAMIDGKEVKIGKVTDEECEKVMNFLKSLNQVMRCDQNVTKIMDEETGAYFSGQKSAEETANLIQNRVQTYLNEIQ